LEIQDLLNIDYEKLGEMKEKCLEYIEILSSLDDREDENDEQGYRKLMLFFCDKLNVKFKTVIIYFYLAFKLAILFYLTNLNIFHLAY